MKMWIAVLTQKGEVVHGPEYVDDQVQLVYKPPNKIPLIRWGYGGLSLYAETRASLNRLIEICRNE